MSKEVDIYYIKVSLYSIPQRLFRSFEEISTPKIYTHSLSPPLEQT
jgi:hypothetical protein